MVADVVNDPAEAFAQADLRLPATPLQGLGSIGYKLEHLALDRPDAPCIFDDRDLRAPRRSPRWIVSRPATSWVAIVGITARAL